MLFRSHVCGFRKTSKMPPSPRPNLLRATQTSRMPTLTRKIMQKLQKSRRRQAWEYRLMVLLMLRQMLQKSTAMIKWITKGQCCLMVTQSTILLIGRKILRPGSTLRQIQVNRSCLIRLAKCEREVSRHRRVPPAGNHPSRQRGASLATFVLPARRLPLPLKESTHLSKSR